MNEIEALSRIINYDINDSGKCVADYCEEECEVVAKALTELAEIKKRAEEKRELLQNGIETSKGTAVESFVEVSNTYKIRLIDYIIKGETK